MEKQNPPRSSGLRLPIGFRFRPTDEELVLHYLKRKVFSLPLPASIIPEVDVFRTNPSDLPGEPREKRYFFCRREEEEENGGVRDGSGYWKAVGRQRQVVSPAGSNRAVAVKRSHAFYRGNRPHGLKTEWIMDEYFLVASRTTTLYPKKKICQNELQVGDWVVCRVRRKQSKAKRKEEKKGTAVISSSIWDFMKDNTRDGASPLAAAAASSSSCSSGITDVSCNELDQEVISDCSS